eukprot:g654.t1
MAGYEKNEDHITVHDGYLEDVTAVPVSILNPLQIEMGGEVRGSIRADHEMHATPVVQKRVPTTCAYTALSFLLYPQEESATITKIMSVLPQWARKVIALKDKHLLLFFYGMEAMEILMQVIGLMAEASKTPAAQVLARGECIAFNIIVLPTMIWISTRYPSLLVYAFATEIVIDKAYIGLALARPPSSLVGHANVHIPALMTIVTVNGFESMKKDTARKLRGSGVFAATMSVIGVVFGVYVAQAYTTRAALCAEEIGDIAVCANPRYYFASGLFGDTSCGFEMVESFSCSHASVEKIHDSQQYREMPELTEIDISNTPVISIPSSWGLIQNLTSLRMRGSQVRNVPWAIVTLPKLTTFDVHGAPCESSIEWSDGVLHSGSINGKVKAALIKTVTSLDISKNNLDRVPSWLEDFAMIKRLDFSGNNMTRFEGSSFLGRRDEFLVGGNPIVEAHLEDTTLVSTDGKRRAVQVQMLLDVKASLRTMHIDRWVDTLQGFSYLKKLNVAWKTNEKHNFPVGVSAMTNLVSLELSEISIEKPMESFIDAVTVLQGLQRFAVAHAGISGTIPARVSVLTNLRHFELHDNALEGTIPYGLYILRKLQVLNLGFNKFTGTILREISLLSRLQELYLDNTQVNGTIPREISLLSPTVFAYHADQWHNSSRDIDAEQFADITFVQLADRWHNSSRDIDAQQFADIVSTTHANQRHNSSRDIDVEQFAEFSFGQNEEQWYNSSGDMDAEQIASFGAACHSYQRNNFSRDIDASQFTLFVFVGHTG